MVEPAETRRSGESRPNGKPAARTRRAVDREQIIKSAVPLFRELGYHATSMQDIADAVGILKGSLYHHIGSKEDLLVEMLLASVSDVLAVVTEIGESQQPPREKLRRMIEVELIEMARHQDEIMIWSTERRRMRHALKGVDEKARATDDVLCQILREGAETGQWPESELPILYQAIRAMVVGFPSWYREGGGMDITDVARRLGDYAEAMADAHS